MTFPVSGNNANTQTIVACPIATAKDVTERSPIELATNNAGRADGATTRVTVNPQGRRIIEDPSTKPHRNQTPMDTETLKRLE